MVAGGVTDTDVDIGIRLSCFSASRSNDANLAVNPFNVRTFTIMLESLLRMDAVVNGFWRNFVMRAI